MEPATACSDSTSLDLCRLLTHASTPPSPSDNLPHYSQPSDPLRSQTSHPLELRRSHLQCLNCPIRGSVHSSTLHHFGQTENQNCVLEPCWAPKNQPKCVPWAAKSCRGHFRRDKAGMIVHKVGVWWRDRWGFLDRLEMELLMRWWVLEINCRMMWY